MEFGNYYLMEPKPFLQNLTNEDFQRGEIWKISFCGARSKNGSGTKIILINHTREIHKFSYRLTWLCTNNAAKYEALCLGLEQAIKMQIWCLKIKCDLELIINQVMGNFFIKHHYLKSYRNKVWDLFENFEDLHIQVILRKLNQEADALA